MDIIQRYSEYREIGIELNNKMMKRCMSKGLLEKSAKLLGLWEDNTCVFADENDMTCLMDFALNDLIMKRGSKQKENKKKREQKQNCNQWYLEKYRDRLSAMEIDLLTSNTSSYTSLFEILEIKTPFVFLKDLLNKGKKSIKIIDINLSKTTQPHYLLFIRLGELADFCKTSGMILLYLPFCKEQLVEKYWQFIEKYKGTAKESVARFIFFFKLRHKYGVSVAAVE